MSPSLRVSLLGVRLQASLRYQIAVHVSTSGSTSSLLYNAAGSAADHAARTEVSDVSSTPDFANRVFVLHMPHAWGTNHSLGVQIHAVSDTRPASQNTTLLAQAALQLAGPLLDRLAKGEHVPVTMKLQPLVDSALTGRKGSGQHNLEDKQEVTLELMLLGSCADPKPKEQAMVGQRASGKGPAAAALDCELLCHVAMATQLPPVGRGNKKSKQPAIAVMACIVSGDGVSSRSSSPELKGHQGLQGKLTPAPVVTPPVPASSNPVWDHCLTCGFAEGQMQTGQLQLALMNEADGTVISRCMIPLRDLQLRRHYNLQLLLDIQSVSGQPGLYVTLCLAKCPALEATALQSMRTKQLTLLQARLASCPELRSQSGVFASWRIAASPAAADAHPPKSSVAAEQHQIPAAILQINASSKSSKGMGSVPGLAPASLSAGRSWPANHGAQLMVQPSLLSSTTAALVMDLYRWPQPRVAKSDLRTSAVAKLGRARSRGQADSSDPSPTAESSPTPELQLATLARSSVSSSGSSSSSGQGRSETLRSLSQAGSVSDAESDSVSGALAKRGDALVPLGRAVFPLRHLPEDRSGAVAELDGELVGVQQGVLQGLAEGSQVVVEVQAWDASHYSAEQLEREEPSDATADTAIDLSLVSSPSYMGHVVSVLTDDLISKQSALDKLQRAVLRAEGSSQLGQWRVQEAEKRNGVLAADLAQLRKLLHEEKSSSKAALSVKGWEAMPRGEIVTRACQAVAAVAHEKSRNAELVYRLQQTHEEGIEAKLLRARFAELQEAHVTQGRLVQKLEAQRTESEQTLGTVKSQEKVIAKLEELLRQASQEHRADVATAGKLQQQLEAVDSRLDTTTGQVGVLQEENARLKAFNKYEEVERVQKLAAEETEAVRKQLTAEADAARTKAAADVEAVREGAGADTDAIRQKATADVDAIRTQCTALTDQLRAQYSAESESARNARFEELERWRNEKNAEIEALRERHASELKIWRDQRAADSDAARGALEQHRAESDEQMELMSQECDSLRAQLEDAKSREDNAKDNAEEFESERLSASMRAEKAEASAIAAQHELIDVTKRYAREIAMLKTRLAEKDAQLMGGFGALSNMQLGGSRGWLGGLPDPDLLAASLPTQTHPHTQPHPLPTRQTAWVGQPNPGTSTSFKADLSLGQPQLPQQLARFSQDAGTDVARSAQSPRRSLNSQQGSTSSRQGMTLGLDQVAGPSLERPAASQGPQGSPKKPSQARPVLLPLSASQNQLQSGQPASQSLASTSDSLPAGALSPAALALTPSGPAAGQAAAAAASASRPVLTQLASADSDDADSRVDASELSSDAESYSDIGSEASASGASDNRQVFKKASQQAQQTGRSQGQSAAVQAGKKEASISSQSSQSSRSVQSLQESVAKLLPMQILSSELQPNAAQMDFMLNSKAKKKWRMFG